MSNLALQHFLGRHQLPESYLLMAESAFSPLIDEFNKSNLEIDKKIGGEIDSLYSSENIP